MLSCLWSRDCLTSGPFQFQQLTLTCPQQHLYFGGIKRLASAAGGNSVSLSAVHFTTAAERYSGIVLQESAAVAHHELPLALASKKASTAHVQCGIVRDASAAARIGIRQIVIKFSTTAKPTSSSEARSVARSPASSSAKSAASLSAFPTPLFPSVNKEKTKTVLYGFPSLTS